MEPSAQVPSADLIVHPRALAQVQRLSLKDG
jgi:hypothetical protein